MRSWWFIAGLAASLAGAGPAAAADVRLMVVGKDRVLRGSGKVVLERATVRAAGRRCRVAARTPLAALARSGLTLRVRDYGSCGRRPVDAGGLYVTRIGPDRARGRDGWVYKVGRRTGTAGAADPAGPFGSGGLRDGQRVLWFWCRLSAGEACQRTLEAQPAARTAAPGSTLRVTVRGYDDRGRGVPVAGATVRLGSATAATGEDGVAEVVVPAGRSRVPLHAEHPAMVRSFPTTIAVA